MTLSQTLRCASHCRAAVRINSRSQAPRCAHTAESSSMVCIPLCSQARQCASCCGVKIYSVHHTSESNCTPQSQNRTFCWSLVAFKGTIRRNPFMGEHIYYERKYLKYTKWAYYSKPKILTLQCHANRRVEFFELFYRISRRNQNQIPGPGRARSMKKMEVENLVTRSL